MMANNNLLLLLIFHLLAAFSVPSEARCLENHRRALLQLKGGLGNSALYLSSWTNATDSDCCVGWHGVTCDPLSAGEVTSLDLHGLCLGGTVDPDALFSLTNLTTLNLAFNYLDFSEVVSSPREFEKLHRLKFLNLSNSGFRGQIPMGIATLTNLVSLDLSILSCNTEHCCLVTSYLKYSPHLTQLIRNTKSLEKLYLDGVDLSSDGIDLLVALSESHSRLAELSLRECKLSRSVYHSIAKLGSLTLLRLDGNNLTSVNFGFLRNLSSLEILDLRYCTLTGSIPEEIFLLKNLRSLDMFYNPQLDGSLPEMVRGLVSLESLDLSHCNLSGPIPEGISLLKNLTSLDMSHNRRLGGSLPEMVQGLVSLESLDLSRCNLFGPIPEGIFLLKNLTSLDMSDNWRLGGSLPETVRGLVSLERLDISSCNLSGPIPEGIFLLKNLRRLDMSYNVLLGGSLPEMVRGLESLESLKLRFCNLSGPIPEGIFLLKNLTSLDMSHNWRLGGSLPETVRGLMSLESLDLSNCNLSGPIPWSLFSLPSLKLLHLERNKFSINLGELFNASAPLESVRLSSNFRPYFDGALL